MCGRFTLRASANALKQLFPLFDGPALEPRYNIAPTQTVLAVRHLP
jgi:putative SOS response-associated peptidase YedK